MKVLDSFIPTHLHHAHIHSPRINLSSAKHHNNQSYGPTSLLFLPLSFVFYPYFTTQASFMHLFQHAMAINADFNLCSKNTSHSLIDDITLTTSLGKET